MSGDYESLTRFVREVLIEPELAYNTLDTTRSAILSITSTFGSLGWTVVPVEVEGSKQPRHEVTSPDGAVTLKMNGAKVFRHPYHTEKICQRKHLTKRMLEFDGIPTPMGVDFDRRDADIARAYFSRIPKPVVVKPTNSGGSHGVTVGVNEEYGFEKAWAFAVEEGGPQSNILIEQFVRGVELRAMVVGERVDSIVARIQPFVVGDGDSTMTTLVERAQEARNVHYRSKQLPIVVRWDFLDHNGYGAGTVPTDEEIVYLSPLALPADGALLVDVSNLVSPEVKQLAVDARRAIPGLEVGGVDIIIGDLSEVATAVVLEVNTAPSLNLHRYATHGTPREVQLDVVEYFHDQYLNGASGVAGHDVVDSGAEA